MCLVCYCCVVNSGAPGAGHFPEAFQRACSIDDFLECETLRNGCRCRPMFVLGLCGVDLTDSDIPLFAHDPSARPQTGNFLTFLAGFGPRDRPQRRENGHGMPRVDSQVLATILNPLGANFDDLGPDRLSAT